MERIAQVAVAAAVLLLWTDPGAPHLLVRGRTVAELALAADAAVVGKVRGVGSDEDDQRVELDVERVLFGSVEGERLTVDFEGHHAPDYEPGEAVILFLAKGHSSWQSDQTDLERLPAGGAIESAVSAYASLRSIADPSQRAERWRTLTLEHVGSGDPHVGRGALFDLQRLAHAHRPLDPPEMERLVAIIRSEEAPLPLRRGLVTVLAMLPEPDSIPVLSELAGGIGDRDLRLAVLQALGFRKDPRGVPRLLEALEASDPTIRLAAIALLGQMDDARAIAPLKRIAARDEGPEGKAATEALARLRVRPEAE